jgi:GTP:adenosylcobinamide-phosphate guanylyltransferase
MSELNQLFTAIILAGVRPTGDPVAEAAGVPCKAFIPVGGRPMVLRVLDALSAAQEVGTIMLCGPSQKLIELQPELKARIAEGRLIWVAGQSTPSLSTYHALQSVPDGLPVLVTTADHALLNSQIVDFFCGNARRMGCDLAVGLTSYQEVASAFPETKRTAMKFKDGAYCGCNLYGFLNPRSHRAAQFWRQVEQERKKPLRMMRILGWRTVARYLLGRFSLDEGLKQLSHKLEIRIRAVMLPFPQAAVDVDTADDWHFVQSILDRQAF